MPFVLSPFVHYVTQENTMATITLDVPEALAARLAQLHAQLPQLLAMALELLPTELPLAAPVAAPGRPVFDEMLDFLASGPTPAQIVAFKLSPATHRRLAALLDKNREEGLSDVEEAELDVYAQVNHLLLLLKARARLTTVAAQ
jgi:hypothetical protein